MFTLMKACNVSSHSKVIPFLSVRLGGSKFKKKRKQKQKVNNTESNKLT